MKQNLNSGPIKTFGEVLIGGLADPVGQATSGVNVFSFPVPNDVGLLGRPSSQGLLMGGGLQPATPSTWSGY